MKRAHFAQLAAGVVFLFTAIAAHAGVYYELKVVASTGGSSGLLSIDPRPSINDRGIVALVGRLSEAGTGATIENIFTGNGIPGSLTNVSPSVGSFNTPTLAPAVQINNANKILARRLTFVPTPFGPAPQSFVETWDALLPNVRQTLVTGDALFGDFDGLYSYPSINNIGGIVFSALDGGTNHLGTLTSAGGFRVQYSGPISQPVIGDNNQFVLDSTNNIRLFPPAFFPFTTIANPANGFTLTGRNPGISDDGKIVAFYGNLDPGFASTYDTYPGIGIFASIEEAPGQRRIARVAGLLDVEILDDVPAGVMVRPCPPYGAALGDEDGICDPGEPCTPNPELGFDDAAQPIYFTTYSPDVRICVTNMVEGSFVVSFVARPNASSRFNPLAGRPYTFTAQDGLWTVRVDREAPLTRQSPGGPGPYRYIAASPLPVVQIGDKIAGATVTHIGTHDVLALASHRDDGTPRTARRGDHRVCFWANTTAGEMIVRGSRLDTDRDGLLDHWEINGIDVDQDDVVDLDLAAMGANPYARDLFLELDWLAPQGNINYSPPAAALDELVALFANAPGGPITLHIDAGPTLSRQMGAGPLDGGGQISSAGTHIDVVYLGQSGTFPQVPGQTAEAFDTLKTLNFGGNDKRAREFAFRYGILADQIAESSNPAARPAGKSELALRGGWRYRAVPGNDLLIGAAGTRSNDLVPPGYLHYQVILHELGHTLGLRHNGVDDCSSPPPAAQKYNAALYDPRHLSAMNYAHAFGLFGNVSQGGTQSLQDATLPFADDLLQPAILDGRTCLITAGRGLREQRVIASNDAANLFFTTPWGVAPDQTSRYLILTRSYADASDLYFDDWANIELDFASYAHGLGNSFGAGIHANLDSVTRGEPELSDYVDAIGPLDQSVPTGQILSPLSGADLPLGTTPLVQISATDDSAILSVVVHFDVNGDGTIQPATESAVATSTGSNLYDAVFAAPLSGPSGARNVAVEITDVAERTVSAGVLVDIVGNCPGDLTGDRQVNEADLGVLLGSWQSGPGGDLNADNLTDEADLGILLGNWQNACP